MPSRKAKPHGVITVLAGVNGAGKSSIAGAFLRQAGGDYYNPDEFTRTLLQRRPALAPAEANALAWQLGKQGLERAIAEGTDFALETTLGARTIPALLAQAARRGRRVRLWFVGLATVEHHLRRVAARVAAGGHDIPAAKIRARWESSRLNLIRLLPHLHELAVWDNTIEANVPRNAPRPMQLLHLRDGKLIAPADLATTPDWAKPIVAAAYKHIGLLP